MIPNILIVDFRILLLNEDEFKGVHSFLSVFGLINILNVFVRFEQYFRSVMWTRAMYCTILASRSTRDEYFKCSIYIDPESDMTQ